MTQKPWNCISVLRRAQGKWATKKCSCCQVSVGNEYALTVGFRSFVGHLCGTVRGLRASGVRQGVVVELSINMPLWWHLSRNMTPPPHTFTLALSGPRIQIRMMTFRLWQHLKLHQSLTQSHSELRSKPVFRLKVAKTHCFTYICICIWKAKTLETVSVFQLWILLHRRVYLNLENKGWYFIWRWVVTNKMYKRQGGAKSIRVGNPRSHQQKIKMCRDIISAILGLLFHVHVISYRL